MHDDSLQRQIRTLTDRIVQLEREMVGQRSERRPRLAHKRDRFQAVVSEIGGIPADGSGEITIYRNGQPTTWRPTCWNVWMHGDVAADWDTEIVAEFWPDKDRFEIASQGCAAGGSHVALPQ